jgi:hypothetical protein
MENKVPTAKELIKKNFFSQETEELMIDFAKMHIEAFKKEIEYQGLNSITKESIKNSAMYDTLDIEALSSIYPESNIK